MKFLQQYSWVKKICANTGRRGIRFWLSLRFLKARGKWPNLKHPKDLSEHILSTMCDKSFEKYAVYADKIKVRDYIKTKGLGEHLLRIYGVWNNPEDIDFDSLPNKFALKPNNGCGGHFFCKDKEKIDKQEVVKQLKDGLNSVKQNIDFRFEPHYLKIEPRIYCEELIEATGTLMPTDFKFMCVKGEIVDCLVVSNRTKYSYSLTSYDNNWQMKKNFLTDSPTHNVQIEKPENWDEMKNIAKILSADFDFVRVDLYEYKNKVFIGELTYSPQGGILSYYTENALLEMASLYNN